MLLLEPSSVKQQTAVFNFISFSYQSKEEKEKGVLCLALALTHPVLTLVTNPGSALFLLSSHLIAHRTVSAGSPQSRGNGRGALAS